MAAVLDLDQLRTFVAIAESGSFTRAAELVFKTQSAVSMQMRRLEERIGRPIFVRDGRQSRLTDEGERLLSYARRMVRLNDETLAAFGEDELTGRVRFGTPDDYADRFLPEILARFARSNPRVEVTVRCEPSAILVEALRANELDAAIITHVAALAKGSEQVVRREPLLWVTSARHCVHELDVVPLALGQATCCWRLTAIETLSRIGRPHRVLYTSWNASAVGAAVLAGLAVSALPESALRPGMRVLSEADGYPRLAPVEISLVRSWHQTSPLIDALSEHVISSLDNISVPMAAAAE